MPKFCTHCGKEVNDNAIVCIHCGCAISAGNSSISTESKSKSQISLILGIIGIVSAWLFALVGHITSIIGIVLGIKEYKETNRMTGLILSIIGEVCSVLSSIIGAVVFSGIW